VLAMIQLSRIAACGLALPGRFIERQAASGFLTSPARHGVSTLRIPFAGALSVRVRRTVVPAPRLSDRGPPAGHRLLPWPRLARCVVPGAGTEPRHWCRRHSALPG